MPDARKVGIPPKNKKNKNGHKTFYFWLQVIRFIIKYIFWGEKNKKS